MKDGDFHLKSHLILWVKSNPKIHHSKSHQPGTPKANFQIITTWKIHGGHHHFHPFSKMLGFGVSCAYYLKRIYKSKNETTSIELVLHFNNRQFLIHQTLQVPKMEVLTYVGCMDTAYVRENSPPKWPEIRFRKPSILGTWNFWWWMVV